MNLRTRKILDRSFSAVGISAIVIMGLALLIVIVPIVKNGVGAIFFTSTIEHRKLQLNEFGKGDRVEIKRDIEKAESFRKTV